jgi:CubicO group peptidase (beta-lactamase class C family)
MPTKSARLSCSAISFAAALCCAGVVFARPLHAQGLAPLDTLVPSLMKRYEVPGIALAVVRGNTVVALKGFGFARLRDNRWVDSARTLFRLGSIGKLFVATAVMQQLQPFYKELDVDVNRFLEFQVPATWRTPVTLERLLTHAAGFDERVIGYAAPTRDSVGPLGPHLAANLPYRGWPPSRVIGYSNYGFALAAHVVERMTGLPFDRYARERIFIPLGMDRTFYIRVPDSLAKDVADGHVCEGRSCRAVPEIFSRPFPVGLVYGTAADMAQFLVGQLSGGISRAGRALDSGSVRRMQEQHFTADPMLPGMSYGFFNQRNRGHRVLSHAGSVPGTNNLLLIVPDTRLGIYFVANGGRSAFGAVLRDTLLALLMPTEKPAPAPASTVTLSDEYLGKLAGPYQITRYAHRTIEKFPLLFSTSTEVSVDDHRLTLPIGDRLITFAPIDSLHFREVGGERLIAFRRNADGNVTHLIAPIAVFGSELTGTMERRAWHERAHFMNEFSSWLLLVPLIVMFLIWPAIAIRAWLRERRASPRESRKYQRRTQAAVGAAILFTIFWAFFGFDFVAASTRMVENATGIVYGVPEEFRTKAFIPWIIAVLAFLMVLGALASWPSRWWDLLRRTLYTVVTICAVLTVVFLLRWNYLPAVF